MPNALADETSPYLRQHRDNPVDWLPWGPVAHARARDENKPLLVSIGYSACHWCHVMERESFEDRETARLMNELFVCVKVDREERPDVDAIYMEAVQTMTGHGGWPLNVFLTPEHAPFYGGTYFPPEPRSGMPSFRQVLEGVARVWREQPEEARGAGARLTERLARGAALQAAPGAPDPALLDTAIETLRGQYDARHGGFGGAPKFPPSTVLSYLLEQNELEMSLGTLRTMASGGIFDQVGGGFARYAVDRTWTVPHFEKMLYDNALLARAYLYGWQRSRDALLERTCRETLDFMLAELRAPEGGFFSALDADSEGVEGRFYVWTLSELEDALGPLAEPAVAYFGVSERGNFEGANVLEARGPEPDPEIRAQIRARLLARRAARVRPGLDDKRLCSWNALAIGSLAEAGAALGEQRYVAAARDAAGFVLERLRDPAGRLLRSFNRGEARLPAVLEDHAYLLEALLTLYEATFEERWFVAAQGLAETMLDHFADRERGGFFSVADDHERLIVRRKDLEDAPIPSGSASAALGLLRLSALTGEQRHADAARGALALVGDLVARFPSAFGHTLRALAFQLGPVREVALVGPDLDELAGVVRSQLRPRLVLAGAVTVANSAVPLLAGREPRAGRAAAYVCERFACRAPVTEPDALTAALDEPAGASP